jgi:hypothetical protein
MCRYEPLAAGADAPPRTAQSPGLPFERSSRWLRGRILDRLRDAPDQAWTELDGAIGTHDAEAVAAALASMARDGLVELAGDGQRPSARLPTA